MPVYQREGAENAQMPMIYFGSVRPIHQNTNVHHSCQKSNRTFLQMFLLLFTVEGLKFRGLASSSAPPNDDSLVKIGGGAFDSR